MSTTIDPATYAHGSIINAIQQHKAAIFKPEPSHLYLHPLDAEAWFGSQELTGFYSLAVVLDHTVARGSFILGTEHKATPDV